MLKVTHVRMAHVPNADLASRGGYWDGRARSRAVCETVSTLAEAVEVVGEFIARNGLGGGNFADAKVCDGGRVVALVSYNGRVWTPHKWEDPARREYDVATGAIRVLPPCDVCGAEAASDDIIGAWSGAGAPTIRVYLCGAHRFGFCVAARDAVAARGEVRS